MKVIKNNLYLCKYLKKYAKLYIPYFFLCGIMQAVSMVLNIYSIQIILDEIIAGSFVRSIVMIVVFIQLIYLLDNIYINFTSFFSDHLNTKLQVGLSREMLEKTASLDYECFDIPDFYDKRTRALSDGTGTIGSLVGSLTGLFSSGFSLIAVIAVMATYHYSYLIIAILGTAILFVFENILNKMDYDYNYSMTRDYRIAGFPHAIMYTPSYQKENKIFNFTSFFSDMYQTLNYAILKKRDRYNVKYASVNSIQDLLIILTTIAAYVVSIYRINDGLLTIGAFVATVQGTATLRSSMYGVVKQIPNFIKNSRYVDNLREVMDYNGKIEGTHGEKEICDLSGDIELEFKNVTFKYPNTNRNIFENLSFKVTNKHFLAIVGENGMGKTTFFKLLMRLYDPDEGEILVNGKNIKDYDIKSYRKGISACMQDHCYYRMSVRNNITFGREATDEELYDILKTVRLDNVVNDYDNKLDQMMGRDYYEDGIDMSGGQAQKLSLARCLFKKSANLFLLDEPSSSLDALAEEQILEAIHEISKEKTIFMITQRMTMVRYADLIIYIENGTVAECGTHDELIGLCGKYATMYNTQKNRFI